MARNPERTGRRAPKDAARRVKKKPCAMCRDSVEWVDYKDVATLRRYTSDRGKIRARRVTGNCDRHQHAIALAIRTAREMALLPYTQRTTMERPGGRGRGRSGGPDRPPVGVATGPDTAGATAVNSANPHRGDGLADGAGTTGTASSAGTGSSDGATRNTQSIERAGALSSAEGGG